MFDKFHHISYDEIVFEDIIGKGASGYVYQCLYNGNKYAIKLYKKKDWEEIYETDIERNMINDIEEEINIYKKLSKLNGVVRVEGVTLEYQEDRLDNVGILMELLGDDLSVYLQNEELWVASRIYNNVTIPSVGKYVTYNPEENIYWSFQLPDKTKIKIIKSLIESIEEIHHKGIIHCDIKPSNIVYQDEKIKLIDFGASIHNNDGMKHLGWIPGTEGYRGPEQEDEYVGIKSDIYSLGVCMTEIWTGEIWLNEIGFKPCRNEVLREIRKIEKYHKQFGKLIRKCILLDYSKRPLILKVKEDFLKLF